VAFFKHIRQAIANLNPDDVRQSAQRTINVGIVAPTQESLWRIEGFLCPPNLPSARRAEVARHIHRISWNQRPAVAVDLEIWDNSLAVPNSAFVFDPRNHERTIKEILNKRPELEIPLARTFPSFRKPVIEQIVARISKENAVFSMATAIPDIIPFLTLPWIVGEFASDTAFLTMNQIRMAFLIAAASERRIGYRAQKREIASVIAGAFGFRAIARELVGKIPFGGGLIPKAIVAYAGTQVVGRSVERVYRSGSAFTEPERRVAYRNAFEHGKQVVKGLLESVRTRQLAPTRGE
jgi:hypothetical protein